MVSEGLMGLHLSHQSKGALLSFHSFIFIVLFVFLLLLLTFLPMQDIKAPYYDLSELEASGGAVPALKQWAEENVALFDQESHQYFDPEEHLKLYGTFVCDDLPLTFSSELFKALRPEKEEVITKKSLASHLGILMNEPGLVDALFSAFDISKVDYLWLLIFFIIVIIIFFSFLDPFSSYLF